MTDLTTESTTPTAAEIWELLLRGNRAFAEGHPQNPHRDAELRHTLLGGQHPVAAVLGCGDSRAPIEELFDLGIGDLFIVRNAGQVATPSATASLEYAAADLNVRLIVVLAHRNCGAVAATIASDSAAGAQEGVSLVDRELLSHIRPALHAAQAAGEVSPAAVGARHLRGTVAALPDLSPVLARRLTAGELLILGARYDIETGIVSELLRLDATGEHLVPGC